MTDRCIFTVWGLDPSEAQTRIAQVERYFMPLGKGATTLRFPAPGTIVGEITFGGAEVASSDTHLTWGHVLPRPHVKPSEGFDTSGLVISEDAGVVRVTVGAANPVACYEGRGSQVRSWCSHAAGAAILVADVRLLPEAIVDLLALGFVGGESTRFAAVRATRPASQFVLAGDRVEEATFWSDVHRLAAVDPADAAEMAEESLAQSLKHTLAAMESPTLGLTAGADSRVVASPCPTSGQTSRRSPGGRRHRTTRAAPLRSRGT